MACSARVVVQAQLAETERGLVPKGDGWFVLNAREAQWWKRSGLGTVCDFEGERHGAGVQRGTTEGSEAYARFPPYKLTRYRDGWLPD